ELNLQLESALETMPASYNLSGLLRRLAILATNSGVELTSFTPMGAPVRNAKDFYETLSVGFQIRGSFNETLVYMDQISRLKRLIRLKSINLNVSGGGFPKPGEINAPTPSTATTSVTLYRFVE